MESKAHTAPGSPAVADTQSVTYDANGNITSYTNAQGQTTYTYDSQGQLIRENNPDLGITYTYTYDDAGNITQVNTYSYTTGDLGTPTDTVAYTYGDSSWGDLLTAFDGTSIAYDAIGNPTNDGTWLYNWEHGRQLASLSDGTTTWAYTYNNDGLRTQRTNGTDTYTYIYNGSQLTYMKKGSDVLTFTYDGAGVPLSVKLNGTVYFYVVNPLGNVEQIVDTGGNVVASYSYDAWGNVEIGAGGTSLATLNPLRYKGYVYDQETGLYYLQSRYYNPTWRRFINADAFASTGQELTGNNMYAYCGNNPVIRKDTSGNFWDVLAIACAGVIGLTSTLLTVHDICQLFVKDEDGNAKVVAVDAEDSVKVINSSSICTPWMQYGYSFYLNHFSEFSDKLCGTTASIAYEWSFHNAGYYGATAASTALDLVGINSNYIEETADYIEERCVDVDIGKTIYHDSGKDFFRKHAGYAMKIGYVVYTPVNALLDAFVYIAMQ